MRQFDVFYEYGDSVSDGDEACQRFLEDFLEDVDGLDHTVENVTYEPNTNDVVAVVNTKARITEEWFDNAAWAISTTQNVSPNDEGDLEMTPQYDVEESML